MSGYKYFATAQGGEGPDVWDRVKEFSAADFMDAASQANAWAQELGGFVAELYQSEQEQIRDQAKLLRIQAGIKLYQEAYQSELESTDNWIKWCKENEDTHGMNFHQGLRSALVHQNISMTKFLEAVSKLAAQKD